MAYLLASVIYIHTYEGAIKGEPSTSIRIERWPKTRCRWKLDAASRIEIQRRVACVVGMSSGLGISAQHLR